MCAASINSDINHGVPLYWTWTTSYFKRGHAGRKGPAPNAETASMWCQMRAPMELCSPALLQLGGIVVLFFHVFLVPFVYRADLHLEVSQQFCTPLRSEMTSGAMPRRLVCPVR